ncbi:hypothetical protein ACFY4C_39330 [Actinomadura viridis]|uniref:hypothetical protein n=1 Tax=Actinomadura viridis TaxID=58110 RepID=UPI0036B29BC3
MTDTAHLDDLRTELANYLGEKRLLVEAITREFRAGVSANAIARQVSAAFGRDQVKQYLAAVALRDSAANALAEAGLDSVASAAVTGIDAPREAHLTVYADPSEIDDVTSLPTRIRDALRPFHITLAHAASNDPDTELDTLLLDGEPVRLVRLKPRT